MGNNQTNLNNKTSYYSVEYLNGSNSSSGVLSATADETHSVNGDEAGVDVDVIALTSIVNEKAESDEDDKEEEHEYYQDSLMSSDSIYCKKSGHKDETYSSYETLDFYESKKVPIGQDDQEAKRMKCFARPENKVLPCELPSKPLRPTNLLKTDGYKRTWRNNNKMNNLAPISNGATLKRKSNSILIGNDLFDLNKGQTHVRPSLIKSLLNKSNSICHLDDNNLSDKFKTYRINKPKENLKDNSTIDLTNRARKENDEDDEDEVIWANRNKDVSYSIENINKMNNLNHIKKYLEKYSHSMSNVLLNEEWTFGTEVEHVPTGNKMTNLNETQSKLSALNISKKKNSTTNNSTKTTTTTLTKLTEASVAKPPPPPLQPPPNRNSLKQQTTGPQNSISTSTSTKLVNRIKSMHRPSFTLGKKSASTLNSLSSLDLNVNNTLKNEEIKIISRFPINSKVYRHYIGGCHQNNQSDKLTSCIDISSLIKSSSLNQHPNQNQNDDKKLAKQEELSSDLLYDSIEDDAASNKSNDSSPINFISTSSSSSTSSFSNNNEKKNNILLLTKPLPSSLNLAKNSQKIISETNKTNNPPLVVVLKANSNQQASSNSKQHICRVINNDLNDSLLTNKRASSVISYETSKSEASSNETASTSTSMSAGSRNSTSSIDNNTDAYQIESNYEMLSNTTDNSFFVDKPTVNRPSFNAKRQEQEEFHKKFILKDSKLDDQVKFAYYEEKRRQQRLEEINKQLKISRMAKNIIIPFDNPTTKCSSSFSIIKNENKFGYKIIATQVANTNNSIAKTSSKDTNEFKKNSSSNNEFKQSKPSAFVHLTPNQPQTQKSALNAFETKCSKNSLNQISKQVKSNVGAEKISNKSEIKINLSATNTNQYVNFNENQQVKKVEKFKSVLIIDSTNPTHFRADAKGTSENQLIETKIKQEKSSSNINANDSNFILKPRLAIAEHDSDAETNNDSLFNTHHATSSAHKSETKNKEASRSASRCRRKGLEEIFPEIKLEKNAIISEATKNKSTNLNYTYVSSSNDKFLSSKFEDPNWCPASDLNDFDLNEEDKECSNNEMIHVKDSNEIVNLSKFYESKKRQVSTKLNLAKRDILTESKNNCIISNNQQKKKNSNFYVNVPHHHNAPTENNSDMVGNDLNLFYY